MPKALFNHETFNDFIYEHDIELIKNYDNMNIVTDMIIEGKCKTKS